MPPPDPILVHRVIARLNVGGPAMHVVNLSRGLDGAGGFRTRLLAGKITADEGDMAYYARERGVEVTELPALSRLVSPLADLKVFWFLFRLFRRDRPAIVHTHTAKAGTLGRLAAFLARVPVRIHTFHGHVLGGDYFSPPMTRFYLEVERQLARISHRLVVLTPGQRDEMADHLKVAPGEMFSVIPLGLELEAFRTVDRAQARSATRRELGLAERDPVVGIVGRLVPVKNHELLFRAHGILEEMLGRPVQVLVVGSGLREAELSEFVGREGVPDRVHWLGWREGLETLYPALDVLALTSLDEGTPVAVLEALASGTPVVARAVGGVQEILEGVATAKLVADSQPEAMARALAWTLEKVLGGGFPPETVEGIRRETADRFSVERLVRDMKALYTEEMARAGLME